jgi:hypothetical protein
MTDNRFLRDVTQNWLEKNNPDPNNFYGGEIQADIIRAIDVLNAVLGLCSGNTYWKVIQSLIEILQIHCDSR